MTITPTQQFAVAEQLAIDLSTASTDRIIELCLLYRSDPEALPSFLTSFNNELARRFTPTVIASDGVRFAVLQNFANQFVSPIPFFQQKMLEMAASVNRDIWFTDNAALFIDATNNTDLMTWLVSKPDILTKVLHNPVALPMVAKSTIAATAVLTDAAAVAIWKDTLNVWQVWSQYTPGMTVLAKSSELSAHMAASTTAMTAVAASTTALTAIVKSIAARTALMSNNIVFQSVRDTIFSTIKQSWTMTRKARFSQVDITTAKSAFDSPAGFVVAYLGRYSASYPSTTTLIHPNGYKADRGSTRDMMSDLFTITSPIDAISFNGASLSKASGTDPRAVLELWTPPT